MSKDTVVTKHLNEFNTVCNQLETVDIPFDDEVRVIVLLSGLPNSWNSLVISVSNSCESTKIKMDDVVKLIIGKEVRRKSKCVNLSPNVDNRGRSEKCSDRGRSPSEDKKEKSIWVKWILENRLQRKDIWCINPSKSSPWSWNRVLKLREKLFPFIIYTSIYADRKVTWTLSSSGRFSNYSAKALFQPPPSTPAWINLLQNQWAQPKHSLVLWMALQNGLFSYCRFLPQSACLMCTEDGAYDTMQHIFFSCRYSKRCMFFMHSEFGWSWPDEPWSNVIEITTRKWKGKDQNASLAKMILAVLVYNLWCERNRRKNGDGHGMRSDALALRMISSIKVKLSVLSRSVEWMIAWS